MQLRMSLHFPLTFCKILFVGRRRVAIRLSLVSGHLIRIGVCEKRDGKRNGEWGASDAKTPNSKIMQRSALGANELMTTMTLTLT